jgi:transposase-like protein
MNESIGFEGDLPQNHPSGAGPEVLDPEVLPPPADHVVPTKRKKRGGSNIGVVNARAKLRSQETSMQLKELICEHGRSVNQACRELGITSRHGRKLWAVWIERIRQFKEGTAEEVKKGEMEVRAYCEHNTQQLIERCMRLVEDNPAYAAGALRGMELLCKLRGIRLDDPGVDQGNKSAADGLATLEDARKRAGEALGLAVSIEAVEDAEQAVEGSSEMKIIRQDLHRFGDPVIPPFRNANKPLVSEEG